MPYLSASLVVIHYEEVLYQVYTLYISGKVRVMVRVTFQVRSRRRLSVGAAL